MQAAKTPWMPENEPPAPQPQRYGKKRSMMQQVKDGADVCGQKLNGHAMVHFGRMHDLDGKLHPEYSTARVVGNSLAGTIAIKKRDINPARGSSLKKLQRAMNIAGKQEGVTFMRADNPHVHPRHKRVAEAAE